MTGPGWQSPYYTIDFTELDDGTWRIIEAGDSVEGYDFVVAIALGYATDTKEAHGLREEKISRIK